MKLKEKELIAITHLAFYIISADGIATEEEYSAVSTELLTFGLMSISGYEYSGSARQH